MAGSVRELKNPVTLDPLVFSLPRQKFIILIHIMGFSMLAQYLNGPVHFLFYSFLLFWVPKNLIFLSQSTQI